MAGASSLPLAGVEAIVQGLQQFQSDIGKMNTALDRMKPRATLLQEAFSGAWEMVKGFGEEVLRVAEYALGHLLADAIEWVVQKLGELIKATIQAGAEFQTLELRLNGMNFDALIKAGKDYNSATEESIKLTKEQLGWLQKLAATTPYDNTDISNVYTLARSYGFADNAARKLTENTTNFAAAMGLEGDVLERIIMNFGQMVQRGKITSTEMRDLARGSFMPLSDILERIGTKTGMSVKDVMKEISRPGGGLPAQLFIDAFNEMIAEEPRFVGAAGRMAKTFQAASDNAMDVVKSIGGLQIVKPILDAVGARIAAFVSSFTDNPERWQKMVGAAKRVGEQLKKIVDGLLGLLPSSESLADATVRAISGIADWLERNGPGIITFFRELGRIVGGVANRIGLALSMGKPKEKAGPTGYFPGQDYLMQNRPEPFGSGILAAAQKIADFINNTLVPAFVRIQVWFEVNKPLIDEFWKTVWDIISEVISDITGGPKKEGGNDLLTMITSFMKYVIENKDGIVKFVEVLWSLFVVWEVLKTAFNIVMAVLLPLIGAIGTVIGILGLLGITISGPVIAAVLALIAVLGALTWAYTTNLWGIRDWVTQANAWILKMQVYFAVGLAAVVNNIKSINWAALGIQMALGLAQGVQQGTAGLVRAAVSAALAAYNAVKAALLIKSPSGLFEDIGVLTMEGFAQGIEKAAGVAVGAMQSAVGAVAMPAISSMAGARGDTYNTRSANLTIQTSAPRENIIADFSMLESLMGA